MKKELQRYRKGMQFDNPAVNSTIPEGYMTSEEFRKRAIIKVNKFCNENGIL